MSRRWKNALMTGAVSLVLVALNGCEWGSSGGDGSFNTSQGAGVQLNFSGVYKGTMSGGKMVASKGGAPVTSLVIFQSGNAIEVTDNNGSTYRGNVGSPGAVSDGVEGTFSSGAELAQAQISFTGNDNTAGGREINFVGVIHAVAVKDIQGTTTTDKTTSNDEDENSYEGSQTVEGTVKTTTTTNGPLKTVTIVDTTDPSVTVTITTTTNLETLETTTTTTKEQHTIKDTQTDTRESSTTETTTYEITEANTQYRLQGSWIEVGAGSSGVDGLSAGTAGLIQTTTTTTTE